MVDPVPIIAKAEATLSVVGQLVADIKETYGEALSLRKSANRHGLEIGRAILSACGNAEVLAKLALCNSKENKPKGGTATKAHSFLCDELAKCSNYDAKYLKNCCIEYIAGANKFLVTKGGDPIGFNSKAGTLVYGGVLPIISEVNSVIEHAVKAPRVDNMFTEAAAGDDDESLAPEAIAKKVANVFLKHFTRNGHVRLGRHERNAVMKTLNPMLNPLGWELAPIGKE